LRVDQRTTSWNSRYTFSAKEKDAESGYGYFGARYYDSDLSIWLSVDPMSDKYPSFSPYSYCANNPIKYWDPDGRWIPGLDDDGKVTYTAEKGDNHDTFVKQFYTNGKSKEIFKNAGLGTNEGDVKTGAVIKGDAVKKATGNDVLKGDWYNMTKTQKVAQAIFAINHSNSKGQYEFDFNDYASGFNNTREQYSNVTLPTSKGNITIRNFSMWLTSGNTKVMNNFQWSSNGDDVEKFDYRIPSGEGRRSMMMFSIDPSYVKKFSAILR
jgi:RHS repeat-associated protein